MRAWLEHLKTGGERVVGRVVRVYLVDDVAGGRERLPKRLAVLRPKRDHDALSVVIHLRDRSWSSRIGIHCRKEVGPYAMQASTAILRNVCSCLCHAAVQRLRQAIGGVTGWSADVGGTAAHSPRPRLEPVKCTSIRNVYGRRFPKAICSSVFDVATSASNSWQTLTSRSSVRFHEGLTRARCDKQATSEREPTGGQCSPQVSVRAPAPSD